jgi:hypothetical protein
MSYAPFARGCTYAAGGGFACAQQSIKEGYADAPPISTGSASTGSAMTISTGGVVMNVTPERAVHMSPAQVAAITAVSVPAKSRVTICIRFSGAIAGARVSKLLNDYVGVQGALSVQASGKGSLCVNLAFDTAANIKVSEALTRSLVAQMNYVLRCGPQSSAYQLVNGDASVSVALSRSSVYGIPFGVAQVAKLQALLSDPRNVPRGSPPSTCPVDWNNLANAYGQRGGDSSDSGVVTGQGAGNVNPIPRT